MQVAVFILFSTIGLFFLTLILNKWQMNNKLGMIFFGMYIVYYIYSLLTGYDYTQPPLNPCPKTNARPRRSCLHQCA